MSPIADNLRAVRHRIEHAAKACGRAPGEVALLAVSKTFPAQAVREAHAAGQRAFGESYLQEAVEKLAALEDLRGDTEWHFIGPLQSNKARQVAACFDWVHSIDRLKIAQRLSDLRPPGMADLQLCMQVNIDDQPTKSGVAPAEALGLARDIAALPRVRLRGLMCIPAPQHDPVRPGGLRQPGGAHAGHEPGRPRAGYPVHGHVGRPGSRRGGRGVHRPGGHRHLRRPGLFVLTARPQRIPRKPQ